MADNVPDPIVREPEARASVDAIAEGLAETHRMRGQLPDMRAIERVAQDVTREQINRHEAAYDKVMAGVTKGRPDMPIAKLDQAEEWEDRLGTARRIQRPFDPERLRRYQLIEMTPERIIERAAAARVAFLMGVYRDQVTRKPVQSHPYWAHRLETTARFWMEQARRDGLPADLAEKQVSEKIIPILDESIREFGEWNPIRAAAPHQQKIVISG